MSRARAEDARRCTCAFVSRISLVSPSSCAAQVLQVHLYTYMYTFARGKKPTSEPRVRSSALTMDALLRPRARKKSPRIALQGPVIARARAHRAAHL